MSLDETTMERLAYIKNLHKIALELSRKPSPFRSTSLLTFHDASEMFLHLTLEEVGGRNEQGFMAYWWEIKKESDIEISQKESMRDLNSARNEFKHEFRRPSNADLESYRATVNRFFEENVPRVFGINYSEIDLLYLVEFDQTREHLSRAKDKLSNDQTRDAASALQDAFDDMMQEFKDRALDQLGYTPYPTLQSSGRLDDYQGNIDQIAKDASATFTRVSQILKILALGIDYRDYERFQHVTDNSKKGHTTNDDFDMIDIEFAIRFVAETALVLQEIPMNLEGEYQHPRTRSVFDW